MARNANGPGANRAAADNSNTDEQAQRSSIDPKILAAVDRAWFTRHPDRAYRLRAALPNEHPGPPLPKGARLLTLVKQISPGSRARLPMWAVRAPYGCDDCLGAIWDQHAPDSFKRT